MAKRDARAGRVERGRSAVAAVTYSVLDSASPDPAISMTQSDSGAAGSACIDSGWRQSCGSSDTTRTVLSAHLVHPQQNKRGQC